MTTAVETPTEEPTADVAGFFATTSDVDSVKAAVEELLTDITQSSDEDEAQAALTALSEGVKNAGLTLERSRLEREVAVEDAAVTAAQNALIEKKRRLALLTGDTKPKKGRRTKAQKEADDAAEAAAKAAETAAPATAE